jgi:hypothetical protein
MKFFIRVTSNSYYKCQRYEQMQDVNNKETPSYLLKDSSDIIDPAFLNFQSTRHE